MLAAGNGDEVQLASGLDVRLRRPPTPDGISRREGEAEIPQPQLKWLAAELAMIPLIGLIWARVHAWFCRCCRKETNG